MFVKQAMKVACVLAVVAGAGAAFAQDDNLADAVSASTGGWNVQSGNTVGGGNTVIHAQMGFPGVSATLLHGMTSKIDLGGRFSFNYGYEGMPSTIVPGLKLQFILRVGLVERNKINFGLRAEPGFSAYFAGGGTAFGILVPVGFDFGIRASDALSVNLNLDLPMFAQFYSYGGPGSFWVPVLFGAGAEYKIDNNLELTLNSRFGPAIHTSGAAVFAFNLLFGVAYRF